MNNYTNIPPQAQKPGIASPYSHSSQQNNTHNTSNSQTHPDSARNTSHLADSDPSMGRQSGRADYMNFGKKSTNSDFRKKISKKWGLGEKMYAWQLLLGKLFIFVGDKREMPWI